ncbi:MAG: ImcF-related family protein [Paracoccaceae bacterium]
MSSGGDVPGARPQTGGAVFDRLAEPVLAYAERLAAVRGEDITDLLRHAGTLLDRFGADALRAGVIPSAVPPARYALALILDQKARANRAIEVNAWARGAHRFLFEGRDVTTVTLSDFIRKAADAGHDFDGIRLFLERCLARLEGQRRRFDTYQQTNWTGIVIVLGIAFTLAVAGWAGFVEWRYHRDLTAVFDAEALQIGLDRSGEIPDLAQRLDQLERAATQVRVASAKAPIRLFAGLLGWDAAARADAGYAASVQRHLPGLLARGIDEAFATEGGAAQLYDTLRAWSVLSGQAEWAPDYLAGWAADRAAGNATLAGLAPHIAQLRVPTVALPQPDPELLTQARSFAAEADESARAYLELRRAADVAKLPNWRPDTAVPGLGDVMQRRSGLPMSAPVPGLFTAAGWNHARDFGAGIAVQTARAEAARLFPTPPKTRNETPDVLLDILQRETLAQWSALLADLRVRSFNNPETSVLVSGQLALAKSPLDGLLREIWAQAGGNDRRRSHAQQLSIAAEFAATIQYVEQGRMAEISALFASLNVALGAMDRDEATGQQRLMTMQDRAQSVAALRTAPRVVVQIVEDTLAQTGASHADLLSNPLTRAWQTEVLQACIDSTEGRFPFGDGADVDIASFTRLMAPGGMTDRFFRNRAQPLMDTSALPWRWKPEARFNGLSPDSALFFQQAQAITAGFFGPSGQIGSEVTLTALAERGKSFMSIGGQGGPVEAATDSLRLMWPGAEPAKGIDVSFQTPEGQARLTEPGEWGLLRLLGPLRLRERDGGKRFLVDLRSGGARLFLEVGFDGENNPLSRRGLLKGFACPPVL